MIDIQTISIGMASTGVLVAAIYYMFQLRHQTKLRQTEILSRLYSKITERDFLEAWKRFINFDAKDPAAFIEKHGSESFFTTDNNMVVTTLDEIGILLMRKLVDINLVDQLLHDHTCLVWEKTRPFIEDVRKTYPMPNLAIGLEYLYNELKKREQQLASKKA
jgi:hypothetical protein